MFVYADSVRRAAATQRLAALREALQRTAMLPCGLQAHGQRVTALIEAGELAQGLADANADAAADAAMALVRSLARCCARSWDSGFEDDALPLPGQELAECAALLPPALSVEIKRPEGYAFYALYPECYLEAAHGLALPSSSWQVLGLRSIGTSLSAMVAAGLGAGQPLTLRPRGHPFARRVTADPARIDRRAGRYAVVDEGPGLSGSSMAAVAQWLGEAGVAHEQVHFFAGHANGPGPEASDAVRAVWRQVSVHVADFDRSILHARRPVHRLQNWVECLVGPLRAPLEDISAGRWRRLQPWTGADAPPVHPLRERRKFLALSDSGRWLVKFAGLGAEGARKLARARLLAAAGFSPQPAGLCHGFLVERWRDDLVPLSAPLAASLRAGLIERAGDYLGFRGRTFASDPSSGASLERLWEMGRVNTEASLGPAAASAWDRWQPQLAALESLRAPVETDNRMHLWEWLAGGDRILKTDALDHHAGHDPIGCQDIAWDLAGAAVEFDLSSTELDQLVGRCAAGCGRTPHPGLLNLMRLCYLAFELGRCEEAAALCGPGDDRARMQVQAQRYQAALGQQLAGS